MKIFKELLIREANQTGFRAEILEKVWHLIDFFQNLKGD